MINKNFLAYSLAVLIFYCPAAYASEGNSETAELVPSPERWYRIELLIYKQKSTSDTIHEIWPNDLTLSYPTIWAKLKSQEDYISNPYPDSVLATWLEGIKTSSYTPFVLQSESAKTFYKSAKQIQRYEGDVLFHEVWWQPFIQSDTRESPAILIKSGRRFGDHAELEGSVHFTLSRYLHIKSNLWLTDFSTDTPDLDDAASLQNSWPDLPLSPDLIEKQITVDEGDLAIPELLLAPTYHVNEIALIQQSRRMRSDETHYIDHPKLGILVRLTPQPEK